MRPSSARARARRLSTPSPPRAVKRRVAGRTPLARAAANRSWRGLDSAGRPVLTGQATPGRQSRDSDPLIAYQRRSCRAVARNRACAAAVDSEDELSELLWRPAAPARLCTRAARRRAFCRPQEGFLPPRCHSRAPLADHAAATPVGTVHTEAGPAGGRRHAGWWLQAAARPSHALPGQPGAAAQPAATAACPGPASRLFRGIRLHWSIPGAGVPPPSMPAAL
jgi:hypothetical protein